jgi:hypothetical protein
MRIRGTFVKCLAATLVAVVLAFSTIGAAHAHAHEPRSGDDCATCRVVHGASLAAPAAGVTLALVLRADPIDESTEQAPQSQRPTESSPRAPPSFSR